MNLRIDELLARLDHAEAKVRRLAALDLTRRFGELSTSDGRAALWRIYADPAIPARTAHAAILAHDALGRDALPVEERSG